MLFRSHKVRLTSPVRPGTNPWTLPELPSQPSISYRWGFSTNSVDDYLSSVKVTGLLIIKDGKIVVEKYQYSRDPSSRLISFSMAKTLTGMLVGIAKSKGLIESLDNAVSKYWPEIAESAYGQTTIRHLLRMS